ncbi:MAG: hypothetical protein V7607_4708 [Solirubrobacteraceae bacterium]
MPTLQRLADNGLTYSQWHDRAVLADSFGLLTGRNHHQARAVWHKGWKAVTEHGPVPIGRGRFDQDRWQLFHTDVDRAEVHDLADEHPEKVKELVDLWPEEAKKYDVLPLNDLSIFEFRALEYIVPVPPTGQYTYDPGTSEVPEASAAQTTNVSHKILAEVKFTGDSQGVIVAQGSRFGGFSLFVKDGNSTTSTTSSAFRPSRRSSPTRRHQPQFEFTGGSIVKVVFDVADDAYVDVEQHLAAAMARD